MLYSFSFTLRSIIWVSFLCMVDDGGHISFFPYAHLIDPDKSNWSAINSSNLFKIQKMYVYVFICLCTQMHAGIDVLYENEKKGISFRRTWKS